MVDVEAVRALAAEYRSAHDYREGQAAFEAFSTLHPALATHLVLNFNDKDPFYDNTILPAFWAWLEGQSNSATPG